MHINPKLFYTCGLVLIAAGSLVLSSCCCNTGGRRTGKPNTRTFEGPFIQVVSAFNHSCALRENKTVICWGGDHLMPDNPNWVSTPKKTRFRHIAAQRNFNCGIRESDHHVECWGSCSGSQCEAPSGEFEKLFLKHDGGCALDSKGLPSCWGGAKNSLSFLPKKLRGKPLKYMGFPPTSPYFGAVIEKDGTLHMWSQGPSNEYTTPLKKKAPKDGVFTQVAMTGSSVCALREDHRLVCWANKATKKLFRTRGFYRAVSMDSVSSACAIAAGVKRKYNDGRVSCQLAETQPQVKGHFEQIAAGHMHACGILKDQRLRCWGRGHKGQLNANGKDWMR